MTRQALADRLVSYSDTLVAFSLVNGLAFVITLGEPDIRCSIAAVSGVLFGVNFAIPLISTYVLFWLRDYRQVLLDGDGTRAHAGDREEADRPDSEPALVRSSESSAGSQDEVVERFWRTAFWIRIGLIWFFAIVVLAGVFGATQDARCLGASAGLE